MDYRDVIYDQPNNSTLSDKIELVQYNAALAVTGAIRITSRKKLYQQTRSHIFTKLDMAKTIIFFKLKSLTFKFKPLAKSFIYAKNNKGSRTEPCGTPALTSMMTAH